MRGFGPREAREASDGERTTSLGLVFGTRGFSRGSSAELASVGRAEPERVHCQLMRRPPTRAAAALQHQNGPFYLALRVVFFAPFLTVFLAAVLLVAVFFFGMCSLR